MLERSLRIPHLFLIAFIILSVSVSRASDAESDSPPKVRCAAGYAFHKVTGECVPCNRTCSTGLPGICDRGIWDCQGSVPVCAPIVMPGERIEICNGEDDNCDGRIDEGFDKDGDGYTTCMGDCNDNDPKIHPDAVERCDGIDNNCNGLIDEGFNVGGHCTVGVGECKRSGRLVCSKDGLSSVCDAVAGLPSKEVCDGLDNDCNGLVDDGFGEITCGVGECRRTVSVCVDGKLTECVPGEPGPELCGDGLDNNCDGRIDEGFENLGRTCYAGVGACRNSGVYVCSRDRLSLVCTAKPGEPGVEICGNGIDDDCNGIVDIDTPGLGERCDNGQIGECAREGVLECNAAEGTLVCSAPYVEPRPEVCDGLDNDCDGVIDNGVTNACGGCGDLPGEPGGPCFMAGGDECGKGLWKCASGDPSKLVCVADYSLTEGMACAGDDNPCTKAVCVSGACVQTRLRNATPCDDGDACSIDDICIDGVCVGGAMLSCDDGNPCTEDACDRLRGCVHRPLGRGFPNECGGCAELSAPPGSACVLADKKGPCAVGEYQCQPDGWMPCVQTEFGSAEICDGIDNDCNGLVDDGLGTIRCGIGVCEREIAACVDGSPAECLPGEPGVETCSNMGFDDDCNGVVDDIAGLGDSCPVTVGSCVVPGQMRCLGDANMPLCVAIDPRHVEDDDGDGVPNYCARGGSAATGSASEAREAAHGAMFDAAATRAAIIPWREVFGSAVIGADSADRATLLVSGATGERAGFAVLRAREAEATETLSFTICEAAAGERPAILVPVERGAGLLASSGSGYLRYHRITSQIPSPAAKSGACRLYAERIALPQERRFQGPGGSSSCRVKRVEAVELLDESPLVFAGLVLCEVTDGDSPRQGSLVLGIDLVRIDDAGKAAGDFALFSTNAPEAGGARIVALGRGRSAPLLIVAKRDGKNIAGICTAEKGAAFGCSHEEIKPSGAEIVFAQGIEDGSGRAAALLLDDRGEAYLVARDMEGSGITSTPTGRAGKFTDGGAVFSALILPGLSGGERHMILARDSTVTAASIRQAGGSPLRILPHARSRAEARSEIDAVSPSGAFSLTRPHAIAAIPLKGYGGTDLFAAYDMKKTGRSVGSMGFLYLNANEAPEGRISEVAFDGSRGSARLDFSDPTGDPLSYRAWIRARHGGSLDHWVDRLSDGRLLFSSKGEGSAAGLWPIEITVEASDPGGAVARSRAVMQRDGSLESVTESSENP